MIHPSPIEQRHARRRAKERKLAGLGWLAFVIYCVAATSWLVGVPFHWQHFVVGP